MGNIMCCCGNDAEEKKNNNSNTIDLNKISQSNYNIKNQDECDQTFENELIVSTNYAKANPSQIVFEFENTKTKNTSVELENEMDFNRTYHQEVVEDKEKLEKISQELGVKVKKVISFTKKDRDDRVSNNFGNENYTYTNVNSGNFDCVTNQVEVGYEMINNHEYKVTLDSVGSYNFNSGVNGNDNKNGIIQNETPKYKRIINFKQLS